MPKLSNKVAIVTGAAQGIGATYAKALGELRKRPPLGHAIVFFVLPSALFAYFANNPMY